jgi:hypothetical protein|tara:strand:- start:292 stop:486 length:195 start_codon:yes stop_codon:yes gene_type:complete
MNNDEDAVMCPNCGLRMTDPEVCDFCDYKRHEDPDLDKALDELTDNQKTDYEDIIELWKTYGGS